MYVYLKYNIAMLKTNSLKEIVRWRIIQRGIAAAVSFFACRYLFKFTPQSNSFTKK